MKKSIIFMLTMLIIAFCAGYFSEKKKCIRQSVSVMETIESETIVTPYQPIHSTEYIRLNNLNKCTYYPSPTHEAATSVSIKYDKQPYAAPTIVTYTYENGDTHTYILPKEFALRKNEVGRFRVVEDLYHTVWLQGQNSKGKLYEIVFIGDPVLDGCKIRPNSYLNPPYGVIRYCN